MGIDICAQRKVTLNDDHQKRLVTCVNRNPTMSTIDGLTITSIYQRTKSGDTSRDGNPFIYALKRKDGYSIDNQDLYRFRESFRTIARKVLSSTQGTAIVLMPSSHPVVYRFAIRIARMSGLPLINNYFCKATVGDVLQNFDLSTVKSQHKKDVKRVLATYRKLSPIEPVMLKKIDNKIRRYFSPLAINPAYTGPAVEGRIILADDLLSTGTTLLNAKRLLNHQGTFCNQAICLLSSLSSR